MGELNVNATELRNPEKFADLLLEYAENPDETLSRLGEAVGLPEATVRAVKKRLESRYQPVLEEVRRATTETLIESIERKLPMLLDGIDKSKVEKSTLRDIAVAFGVLAEKRQLLKGEPTQILTYEERENLNDLAPQIIKEMERRGMVIEAEYHEVADVTVLPPEKVMDAAVSKTAAEHERRKAKKRR